MFSKHIYRQVLYLNVNCGCNMHASPQSKRVQGYASKVLDGKRQTEIKDPPGLSDTTQHNLVFHVNIKIESSWHVIVSVAVVYRVVALLLLQASFRLGMESEIKFYGHECNIVLSFWVLLKPSSHSFTPQWSICSTFLSLLPLSCFVDLCSHESSPNSSN